MSVILKQKKFGEVLETFGPDDPRSCRPCVFPLALVRCQYKVANKPSQNPEKSLETTQKNEGKWTLFIWLSLSGFWRWNVTICGIYKIYLGITCLLPLAVANYKQCTSSTSVSINGRHAASNPQGCLPVGLRLRIPFPNARSEKRKIQAQNERAASNLTQNPSTYTVVSFQSTTNSIFPLKPTLRRSLLKKFLAVWTFLAARVHHTIVQNQLGNPASFMNWASSGTTPSLGTRGSC